MLVYKTFFKIVKKNALALTIYLAVFMLVIVITSNSGSVVPEVFSDEKVAVAIIDRDNTEVSHAIYEYFNQTQISVEIEDDIDKIQDALYFKEIKYLLTIPQGYGQSFLNGGELELDATRAPDSYEGIYIDMQLEEFLTTLRAYLAMGLDYDAAIDGAMNNLSLSTDVTLVHEEGKSESLSEWAYFYQFLAYALIGTLVHVIGTVMIVFRKKEVDSRMRCSALPLRSRNVQLILGCITMSVALWGLLIGLSVVMYGSKLTGSAVFPYLLGNSFSMMIVGLSLGFLAGNIISNSNNISIFSVSFSMAFSFLGGVFVPHQYMSESVLKFSRLLAPYWYIRLNDELVYAQTVTEPLKDLFVQCVGVQLAFAAAVFAIALLLSKRYTKA